MKQLKSFTKVIWNIKDIYKNCFFCLKEKKPQNFSYHSHISDTIKSYLGCCVSTKQECKCSQSKMLTHWDETETYKQHTQPSAIRRMCCNNYLSSRLCKSAIFLVSDEEKNNLAPCYQNICVNSGHLPRQWLNRSPHTRSADPIFTQGNSKELCLKARSAPWNRSGSWMEGMGAGKATNA